MRPPGPSGCAAGVLMAGFMLAACSGATPVVVQGGDAQRGKQHITAMGCGACHVIDGIRGAQGVVGPPLTGFGSRSYIAGQLPNTPENLVRWVSDPSAIEPGTAMPDVVDDDGIARDIAAYLYTLR